MEHKVTEEGILKFKALTMNRGVFAQLQVVSQEAYSEAHMPAVGEDSWDITEWIGYVVSDPATWFIFPEDGTLKRIRDVELFFVLRSQNHPQPTDELRKSLKQVFLK